MGLKKKKQAVEEGVNVPEYVSGTCKESEVVHVLEVKDLVVIRYILDRLANCSALQRSKCARKFASCLADDGRLRPGKPVCVEYAEFISPYIWVVFRKGSRLIPTYGTMEAFAYVREDQAVPPLPVQQDTDPLAGCGPNDMLLQLSY